MKRSIGIWIRNLTLLGIIAAFAVFFGPQSQIGSLNSIGEVNGEELNPRLFEFLRASRREDEQRLRDQGVPAKTVRDLIDGQVFEEMIQRYLLAQEAEKLGLVVSDAELRDQICSNPTFQREDGRCDPNLFRSLLRANRLPEERDYMELVRRDLLIGKLQQYLARPVRVSTEAARARIERDQTTLRLGYVRVPTASFEAGLEPGEEELRNFLAASDERIRTEYERRRAEFQRREQVRARQILLTGDDAGEKAKQVLERLEAGEDFSTVAAELSEDAGTANAGGDLGFFPRGRLDPALEEAIFDASPGDLKGPIETDRGLHVLRFEERLEEVDQSLEDVREGLGKQLWVTDQALTRAQARAQQLITRALAGESLEELAKEFELTFTSTPEFAIPATRVPGLPALPGLRERALTLTPEAPLVPEPLDAPDGAYVVSLLERKAPGADKLDEQLDAAQLRLTSLGRQEVMRQIYEQSRKKANESGTIRISSEALYRR